MHLIWIALLIIAIDQTTKLIVFNTMTIQESIPVIGDWLRFTYTENPGMAFGINFGPDGLVTALSMSATLLICIYLYKVKDSYFWYSVSIACILGGALGNIIDRVLYGYLLYDGHLFTGRVIDFIHLNMWKGYLPDAVPMIGGKYAALFPIWNVADMAIVTGVIGILVYQNKFQESLFAQNEDPASSEELGGEEQGVEEDSGEASGGVNPEAQEVVLESESETPGVDGDTFNREQEMGEAVTKDPFYEDSSSKIESPGKESGSPLDQEEFKGSE